MSIKNEELFGGWLQWPVIGLSGYTVIKGHLKELKTFGKGLNSG